MRHFHLGKLNKNQRKQVSAYAFFYSTFFHILNEYEDVGDVEDVGAKFRKSLYPGNIFLSNVSNRNTRKRCEICSK